MQQLKKQKEKQARRDVFSPEETSFVDQIHIIQAPSYAIAIPIPPAAMLN